MRFLLGISLASEC